MIPIGDVAPAGPELAIIGLAILAAIAIVVALIIWLVKRSKKP
jgi:hypothetical protein